MGGKSGKKGKGKGGQKKGKPPKVNKYGVPKHQKGDWRHGMIVRYATRVTKGGKVRAIGDRKCAIHQKCDCLKRSDFDGMSTVYNR